MEHKEEKRIQKSEDSINSLWDNFNRSNILLTGVPGEETEQKIGNLYEKIMKENFPNLVKGLDIQVQEAQRVPNKLDLKRTTSRHIIIKMPEVKDKDRLLKVARKKQLPTVIIRLSADFSKKKNLCRLEGIGKKYLKSRKAGNYTQSTQNNLPSKAII